MKAAISLPHEVFEQVEHVAKRLGLSRDQLCRQALHEFLSKHAPDPKSPQPSADAILDRAVW